MGNNEAKAISPNPSITGFLPFIFEASPIPRAATKGTVTVEVVTPPKSYDKPIISGGAKKVTETTNRYPTII